jgi:hypothetical protein
MRYLIIFLAAAQAIAGGTRVLCDSVDTYSTDLVVTDWGGILFLRGDGELAIINPDYTGEPITFQLDLGWELRSWEGSGRVLSLSGSASGRMICLTKYVFLPSDLAEGDGGYIPSPLAVICCRSDGMDPSVLGLSIDAGGGPRFDFSQDEDFVYGSPWLECPPDPQEYVSYVTETDYNSLTPFFRVVLETGEHSGDPTILGDGFLPNPYSDLVAAGWFPPNIIADVRTGEVLLQDTSICSPAIIDSWVLPDAGLALTADGGQVLRFADGTRMDNPGDRIDVYCMLDDGSYVFTVDGGTTVLAGDIDWGDFSYDAEEVPWLQGLYPGTVLHPIPGDNRVVFEKDGKLILASLP